MNNEIGRKLTSLTLMTIMLAGGMVIAAPSMVPEAAAAGQLYVSAENAQFGNLFGGGQVVEIIAKEKGFLVENLGDLGLSMRTNDLSVNFMRRGSAVVVGSKDESDAITLYKTLLSKI